MQGSAFRLRPLLLLALVLGISACGTEPIPDLSQIDVGLPARSNPPDTSTVTEGYRLQGGNAFVGLTGEPTARAIEILGLAGVLPPKIPSNPTTIVTFDSLRIATVAGWIGGGGVRQVARLRFVTFIQPAADADSIIPMGRAR